MSLSDYELRILAELEQDLEAKRRRAEARCWGIALVAVALVSIAAPGVTAGIWLVVALLLVAAGAVVALSDGVRVVKDRLHR
jgi:fatty acid desaturase